MNKEKDLEGIGGWLILVAIGIIITPLRIVTMIIVTYPDLFSSGVWDALTTPESEAYNPLWAPVIIAELLVNCGLLLAWLYMGYKFFTKSKEFPKWYIGLAIFSLAFIVADALAVSLVLPGEPLFDTDTLGELFRALIMVFIWVPYMLVSKRVKATFVK